MNRTIEEAAAEVLRLDARATPGPWRDTGDYKPTEEQEVVASGLIVAAGREPGRFSNADRQQHGLNAALIVTYRTAAPELAREVLRLRQEYADRMAEAHGQGQEQALGEVASWLGCGASVGEVEARCKALVRDNRPGQPAWIAAAERLPSAADHPSGPTRKDTWGREEPVNHVPCLVVLHARPREVTLLQWNLHHLCWDDAGCDDFYCGVGDVLRWMPAPAVLS